MEALVTGVFTVLAALGGVWLTQRHTERMAAQANADRYRDDQRKLISELLIAGRAKMDIYEVVLPALAKFTAKDDTEFVETDTGRRLGEINSEMTRTLTQATLFLGDPQLADALQDVRRHEASFSDEAVGSALAARKDADIMVGVLKALRHVRAQRNALDRLETAAVDLLRARTITVVDQGRSKLPLWHRSRWRPR